MFEFFKNIFCHGDSKEDLAARQEEAHRQDKEIREQLTEKQIDRDLTHTMDASDPVSKY